MEIRQSKRDEATEKLNCIQSIVTELIKAYDGNKKINLP